MNTDGADAHAFIRAASWQNTDIPPVLYFSRTFSELGHCATIVYIHWGTPIAYTPFTVSKLDDRSPISESWDDGDLGSRKHLIKFFPISDDVIYAIFAAERHKEFSVYPDNKDDNYRKSKDYIQWLMHHQVLQVSVPQLYRDSPRVDATFELERVKEIGGQILSRC